MKARRRGGVFARVDGGKAWPQGLLGQVAGDKLVSMVWNSTLSKVSGLTGPDWPSAVRDWTGAGGRECASGRDHGWRSGDRLQLGDP